MRNAPWIGVCLLLGGLLLIGCKQDRAPSKYAAGPKSAFDTPGDPPLTAKTRVAAGMLAESEGDFNRAAGQYHEALKLEPTNHDALYHLAEMLTKQKQFFDAIPTWQQYLQATHNSPEAYCDLAICYVLAGQLDKSEATFHTGIAANPNDTTCRTQYCLMLARQNRFNDAAARPTPLLKPAEISYRFGFICQTQGKLDQAKAYYIKAIQQDPNMAQAKARLASLK